MSRKRPLLVPAVALALGAAVGGGASPTIAWVLLGLASLLLALAFAAGEDRVAARAIVGAALAIGAAGSAAEAARYRAAGLCRWLDQTPEGTADPVRLVGVLSADARDMGDR